MLLLDKDWNNSGKLKISGISLDIGFNFYWHELMEGLEHEESCNMAETTYHKLLEWYNECLFNNEENLEPEDVDEDVIDGDWDDPNEEYHRMWL